MNIADATGSRWITVFNEDSEKILGMSAQELGELKENDNDAYMQKFGEASFKRFAFTVRAKADVYQVNNLCGLSCQIIVKIKCKIALIYIYI